MMRSTDQLVIFGRIISLKISAGGNKRLLLNVKGINLSALTYRFGKEKSISSVAHCEVYGNVTFAKVLEYKMLV